MMWVVFLRAVNVGGHQKFQPGKLAGELAELGVVNVGAAGTFVVREAIGKARLREEFFRRLPFQPEMMICPAGEVAKLARTRLFGPEPCAGDTQRFVSVMEKAPRKTPDFPLEQPAGSQWEVRVTGVTGQFALSLRRQIGRGTNYPNALVEKHFGVAATTRGWNTIMTICGMLEK